MVIASLLKQSGHYSEVVEADLKTIRSKLLEGIPTILAFSTPTVFSQTYLELNKKLKKEFQFFSVFGGPHPTFFPEMIGNGDVDGICIGEGEYPMLELMRNLSEEKSVAAIRNLWVREDGKIHRNPIRPLIQNLDHLPLPDHELFRRAIPYSIWHTPVLTGRGCPYSCTYCFNHLYRRLYAGKGRYIRRRSVDNVLKELKKIKSEKSYKYIKFADDIFTLSPEWVEEFCLKYREQIGLPFSCLVRANHVTAKMLGLLKEAGCYRITMGLEAGNDHIRNNILKRNMSKADILSAARLIKEHGIVLQTANILGIPGGSIETDIETLKLNIQCRSDYSGVTLLQPYPRTEIYRYAEKLGMLGPQLHFQNQTFRRASVLQFKDATQKRLTENLQKLFPLAVQFPWLFPVVKALIKLPSNPIFNFIFSRWVNYCHYFRIIPPRVGWRNIWKRSKLYYRITRLYGALIGGLKRNGIIH